jgi:serine protease AprX
MTAHRTIKFGLAAVAAFASALAGAGTIGPQLAQEMARHAPGDRIAVIIRLSDRVDLLAFELKDRRRRHTGLMRALQAKSAVTLPRLAALLDQSAASARKPLWINNAIAVTVPVSAIDALARHGAVDRIEYDAVVTLAAPAPRTARTAAAGPVAAWNFEAIQVPAVWSLGALGAGIVVANMDTGVDPDHPDLQGRWRGGANSWFDPNGQHPTPYDANGHGTQTMGLIVGGDASGAAIGIAPQAKWVAAKIFNDAGQATLSNIHLAFQWLLDPDGDPATVDAPDVVNASWGLTGGALGACNMEFNDDIQALATAGIAVVFAAGNDGPAPASSASPAANPAGFSVGAVDGALNLVSQSSRGPSGCDGSVFPKLVAPGQNVVSSDLSFGGLPLFATVSGTSFAAPHVAGAMALLASAFPAATVTQLRNALTDSAVDMGAAGADNNTGFGLLNTLAAHHLLANGNGGLNSPVITSLPATEAFENQQYRYQMSATDADGGLLRFALAAGPAGMSIDAVTGLLSWIPTHAQLGANAVTVSVTDPTARSATQSYSILAAPVNSAPVAAADSYSTAAGSALAVAAPGVLANDRDAEADPLTAQLATGPAHGTLTLSGNGGFQFVPAAGYAGIDSFSYRASDGRLAGNLATVTIKVLAPPPPPTPPVARNDSFSAPVYRSGTYAARKLAVLANDTGGTSAIVASSVTLASAPNKGGRATVNSDGTLSYTPALRYSGVESFSYKVRDSSNAWSNLATVAVTVN